MFLFMFPGQGSQRKGMAEKLFDQVEEYLSIESQVDDLLGYSLRELCLKNPDNRLNQTQYTQPSLFVVNALHYYKALADGMTANVLVGHSLGEYNALHAAGAFDFLTGIKLVKKRGELMARAKDGAMAAVIGMDVSIIRRTLRTELLNDIDVANFNSPFQTVISGSKEEILRAGDFLKDSGAKSYIPLPVSAAFHSRFMIDAAREYQKFLVGFEFNALTLPVISNVTARPYPGGDPGLTIRSFLVRQITQSVKWNQSVMHLLAMGVTDFKELGPGQVLSRLVENIRQPQAA